MTLQPPVSNAKAATAIVLLILLGVACVFAGRWQLQRGNAREALQAAILKGQQAPARTLDAHHREAPDWYPARATGRWLDPFTVLLDNRNLKGRAGLWVATPLELKDSPGTAVLVLRGWMARPEPGTPLPTVRGDEGWVTVHGTLRHTISPLFDLGRLTGHPEAALSASDLRAGAQPPPRVQNLQLEALARATGLDLLPVIIAQDPTDDAGLIQDWPGPSIDARQNYNYALQWFSFALIALGAAAVVAWRTAHKRKARSPKS